MGFVALLGVIALAGMIIRNAVILISEVDSNLAQEWQAMPLLLRPQSIVRAPSA